MNAPVTSLAFELVLAEFNDRRGSQFRLQRQLSGGEQNGAYVLVDDELASVLKWQPVPWKVEQLLRAFPAVRYDADRGWLGGSIRDALPSVVHEDYSS